MRLTYVHMFPFATTLGDPVPEGIEITVTVTGEETAEGWATVYAPAFEPAPKKQRSERSRQAARDMHRRGFRR